MHATTYSSFLSKQHSYSLSFSSLKRIREYPNVTLNGTLVPQELHVSPIDPDLAFGTLLEVFVAAERCEAPVLGDDDLLATGEFVLGATEGFDGCGAVCRNFESVNRPLSGIESVGVRLTIVTSPHGKQNLANIHTSNGSVGLAPRTTHPSLQSIGTGTRQHLVDADDVVRVGADTEMETFLAGDFDKISERAKAVRSYWCEWGGRCVGRLETYLLAQIRAASRASEDSCSYSLETMWTQRGNSSTLARLRPRSKMRILGSGTPRLKRDLGYGCREIGCKQ